MKDPEAAAEQALIDHLLQFVPPGKRERMEAVASQRTAHLQVVLEDIFQPHNASAVVRSCECFGIQHVHVIEKHCKFTPNREVAMGSSKWIHLHRWQEPGGGNPRHCLRHLRESGIRIVATSLDADSRPVSELSMEKPTALCFGTEEAGLSQEILEAADERIHIPMHGFTQSFNVSVSVALCLFALRERMEREAPGWPLSPAQLREVYRLWLRKTIRNHDIIVRTYLRERGLSGSGKA